MSDLEKLTLALQAQLLDVLESVVKSAMHKITDLVQHGFLEEVKRSNQELETLRMKLEQAEIRLIDLGVDKRKANGTFLNIPSDGNGNTSEEMPVELHSDVLMSFSGQTKSDSTERLTGSQLCVRESEADEPPTILNPAKEETHSEEHAIVMPTVKKENEEGPDSLSENMSHEYSGNGQETMKADVLSNNDIETDLHILNACNNPEGLETSDTPTDILVNAHTNRMGLRPHQHRVRPDGECHTAKTNCSSQQAIQQVDYMTQSGTSRDHLIPSQSSIQRTLNGVSLRVSLKPEVFLSSDDGVGNQQVNMIVPTKPVFPCSVKQMSIPSNTLIPESLQHSEDVTCNRLQTPMKKLPNTRSKSSSSLSRTQSRARKCPEYGMNKVIQYNPNVDTLNRNPSTLNSRQSPSSNSHRSHILSHQQVNMIAPTKPVFPCSVKQMSIPSNTLIPESLQHSEDVTCNRLQTPMKKLPNTRSKSSSSLSRTQSRARKCPEYGMNKVIQYNPNVDTLNRNPSTLNSRQSPSSNSHRSHILSHPNRKPDLRRAVCCGQCGKYLTDRSNLKAHLETHRGVKPFCCSFCGRKFSKRSNLKTHRRIHTGERPYSCLTCGKGFTQKCNLIRHQSVHVSG
ncbi:uncharacterized protein LOC144198070 [Stigmatopora nigra]